MYNTVGISKLAKKCQKRTKAKTGRWYGLIFAKGVME